MLRLPGARWLFVHIATQRIRDELAKLGLDEEKIMGSLTGYKTYIAAGLAVLTQIASYLTGDQELKDMLAKAWEILMPLALIFLRLGVANGTTTPAPVPAPPAA